MVISPLRENDMKPVLADRTPRAFQNVFQIENRTIIKEVTSFQRLVIFRRENDENLLKIGIWQWG